MFCKKMGKKESVWQNHDVGKCRNLDEWLKNATSDEKDSKQQSKQKDQKQGKEATAYQAMMELKRGNLEKYPESYLSDEE